MLFGDHDRAMSTWDDLMIPPSSLTSPSIDLSSNRHKLNASSSNQVFLRPPATTTLVGVPSNESMSSGGSPGLPYLACRTRTGHIWIAHKDGTVVVRAEGHPNDVVKHILPNAFSGGVGGSKHVQVSTQTQRFYVSCVVYILAGHQVWFGTSEGKIHVFDAAVYRHVAEVKHHSALITVLLHTGGNVVFSGSTDGKVIVWKIQESTDQQQQPTVLRTIHYGTVAVHSILPVNPGLLLIGLNNGTIVCLKHSNNYATTVSSTTVQGHGDTVSVLAMYSSARVIVSGGNDGLMVLWSVAAAKTRGEDEPILVPVVTLSPGSGARVMFIQAVGLYLVVQCAGDYISIFTTTEGGSSNGDGLRLRKLSELPRLHQIGSTCCPLVPMQSVMQTTLWSLGSDHTATPIRFSTDYPVEDDLLATPKLDILRSRLVALTDQLQSAHGVILHERAIISSLREKIESLKEDHELVQTITRHNERLALIGLELRAQCNAAISEYQMELESLRSAQHRMARACDIFTQLHGVGLRRKDLMMEVDAANQIEGDATALPLQKLLEIREAVIETLQEKVQRLEATVGITPSAAIQVENLSVLMESLARRGCDWEYWIRGKENTSASNLVIEYVTTRSEVLYASCVEWMMKTSTAAPTSSSSSIPPEFAEKLQGVISKYQAEILRLESEIETKDEVIAQLEQDRQEEDNKGSANETFLTAEVTRLQRQCDDLQEELNQLKLTREKEQTTLANTIQTQSSLSFEAQLVEAKAAHSAALDAVSKEWEQKLKNEIEKIKAEGEATLRAAVESNANRETTHNAELSELKQKIAKFTEDIEHEQLSRQDRDMEVQQLHAALTALQSDTITEREKTAERIAEAEADRDTYKRLAEEATEQAATHKAHAVELEGRLVSKLTESDSAQGELMSLYESAKLEAAKEAAARKRLESDVAELTRKVAILSAPKAPKIVQETTTHVVESVARSDLVRRIWGVFQNLSDQIAKALQRIKKNEKYKEIERLQGVQSASTFVSEYSRVLETLQVSTDSLRYIICNYFTKAEKLYIGTSIELFPPSEGSGKGPKRLEGTLRTCTTVTATDEITSTTVVDEEMERALQQAIAKGVPASPRALQAVQQHKQQQQSFVVTEQEQPVIADVKKMTRTPSSVPLAVGLPASKRPTQPAAGAPTKSVPTKPLVKKVAPKK
eukprot:PhF_6_TR553/c0_g3_i1/m.514